MVWLGFEPRTSGWLAQMNPLSNGAPPPIRHIVVLKFIQTFTDESSANLLWWYLTHWASPSQVFCNLPRRLRRQNISFTGLLPWYPRGWGCHRRTNFPIWICRHTKQFLDDSKKQFSFFDGKYLLCLYLQQNEKKKVSRVTRGGGGDGGVVEH